jgi:hypothetical protein
VRRRALPKAHIVGLSIAEGFRYGAAMANRAEMIEALKVVTLPRLKSAGFTGSLPHLRRVTGAGGDLVSFQFNRHGGSFLVEIARCSPDGIENPSRGRIPLSKATAQDRHPANRKRIEEDGEQWFSFVEQRPETVATIVANILINDATWATVSHAGSETPYRDR